MKVFFVNDSSDNSNWGDRAAAVALREMIKSVGGSIHAYLSEGDLASGSFGLSKATSPNKQTYVRKLVKKCVPPLATSLKNRLASYFRSADVQSIPPSTWEQCEACKSAVYQDYDHWKPLIEAINQSDAVFIHGNGAITGSRVMPRSILFLAYLIKTDFDIPVVISNHTLDINNNELNELVSNIYPLFDDVVYREDSSFRRYESIAGGEPAADSAFTFKPIAKSSWLKVVDRPHYFDVWPDRAELDPSQPYICVGGSSIYTEVGDHYDPFMGFSVLVQHLKACYSGQVVLTVSAVRDEWFLRKVAMEQDLPVVGLCTPVQQAVDIVGNAEAYIGGRWHPSIFALSGGTPVVALSAKTFKMQALMQMCELHSPYNALALEQETDKIVARLFSYINKGSSLRQKLKAWAQEQETLSWRNIAYIRRLKERVDGSP